VAQVFNREYEVYLLCDKRKDCFTAFAMTVLMRTSLRAIRNEAEAICCEPPPPVIASGIKWNEAIPQLMTDCHIPLRSIRNDDARLFEASLRGRRRRTRQSVVNLLLFTFAFLLLTSTFNR
jgi:hypothetical protein